MVLEDGNNGVTVNVNDGNVLGQKISELLDNPKKGEALGENTGELIVVRFALKKELAANLTVYRKPGL